MKLKFVLSQKELRAGQFYIRAVINYRGTHWCEVLRVLGRPYRKGTSREYPLGYVIRTASVAAADTRVRYLTDLGISSRHHTKLLPFSNKALAFLKSLSKKDFYQVVTNERISDKAWEVRLDLWEIQKDLDHDYNVALLQDTEVQQMKRRYLWPQT